MTNDDPIVEHGSEMDGRSCESGRRCLGLDLVRFAAVILVLGRHASLSPDASAFEVYWKRGGWTGVDLFFVLSGYLVSGLLFSEQTRSGRLDVTRFLIRRAFKIYPAFWFFLIATGVMSLWLPLTLSVRPIIGELLFLQNYVGGVWAHTWSLAVEEHFYILLAILFAYCSRTRGSLACVPRVVLGTAIVCLGLRVASAVLIPTFSPRAHLFGTHIRLDSLAFGVLLAWLTHFQDLQHRMARLPSGLLLVVAALSFAPSFLWQIESHRWLAVFGVVGLYVGSGCIVLMAVRIQDANFRLLKVAGAAGAASYSVYLWHMPVELVCRQLLTSDMTGMHRSLYWLAYVAGSFVVGAGMGYLIEQPALRLRNRLVPSTSIRGVQQSDRESILDGEVLLSSAA